MHFSQAAHTAVLSFINTTRIVHLNSDNQALLLKSHKELNLSFFLSLKLLQCVLIKGTLLNIRLGLALLRLTCTTYQTDESPAMFKDQMTNITL